MKTIYKLKGLFFMMLALMMGSNVLAQEVITSTFTDKNLTTEEGIIWEGGPAENYDNTKGAQFTSNTKQITLKNQSNIVSIEVTYSTSSKTNGTFSIFIGETQIGDEITLAKSQNGIIQKFESTTPISGDAKIAMSLTKGSLYIKKIIITRFTGTGLYVPQPSFSKQERTYIKPFDLTITANEGTSIKYTTDGSNPSIENGTEYKDPIHIDATTTIKAIAIKDGSASNITEATYTFIEADGNGSLEKPYSINDIQYLEEDDEGWFIGRVLGSYQNGGNLISPTTTNWAVGTEQEFIPVELPSDIRTTVNALDNTWVLGTEVKFYGYKTSYFGNDNGIKGTSQVYGLYDLNITEAGYGTYFANHAFVVPSGVEVGIVTNASSTDATLTIDWSKYKEGDIVPANTGIILKGKEGSYPYIVDDSGAKAPEENLLKGSTTAATTEGENCLFYKLSYDNNGENLGFYWAAEDGAAFTSEANKAYLALTTTVAQNVRGFGLEGDGTTGISQIENGEAIVNVYTIDGIIVRKQVKESQALNGLKKGIYIVNGKKIIK